MNEQQFKALPLDQRKAHQQRLQALGLYTGKIDGNWGDGTRTAFDGEDKRRTEDQERARKGKIEEQTASADAEKKKAEADAIRAKAGTDRLAAELRKKYNEQSSSALGMAAQSAASLAAPAAAGVGGLKFGDKVNSRLDRAQDKRNAALRGAAEDRVKGLTTREGAISGTKLAGAMPYESRALRAISRMAPQSALGALSIGKGAQLLSDVDDQQPFYPRMADRAAGLGYIGFGAGLTKRGIEYAASPGVSPDAQALSVINSSQLRRNGVGAPQADAKPLTPRAALVEQAKAAGIKNIAKKNMTQLQDALKALPKNALAVPGAAAAIAYGMTPSDAQASPDGASVTGNDRALTNAAGAAGATYGMSRLMSALGRAAPTAMKGVGIGAGMAGPMSAMTGPDFTPETEQFGRNNAVRDMPFLRHVSPPHAEAYEMAQVPERSPANSGPRLEQAPPEASPRDDEFSSLISAAEQDPEIAALIQQMVQERLAAQPVQ